RRFQRVTKVGGGTTTVRDRCPFAPTDRTPAHKSSSCESRSHEVPLVTRISCSCVAEVVRLTRTSYEVAPSTGFHVSIHFCPPDCWSRLAVTLSGVAGAIALDTTAAAFNRATFAT